MENKRSISKENTFSKIIASTNSLILKDGVLKVTTLNISKHAHIAHGTVFAHFKTKEDLIIKVIKDKLLSIAKKLKDLAQSKQSSLVAVLENYFDLMINEERFFEILAIEFPFFPEVLKKEIISTEAIMKNIIYAMIERGIKINIYKKTDITMAISYFFGTLNYYLTRKDFFSENKSSVLRMKKNSIINTFFQLLNK